MNLDGRSVVITGGFGSLGTAVANAAAAAGSRVALIDRVAQAPTALHGFRCYGEVDLADPAIARRSLDTVAEALGGIDALVNVAGGFRWEKIEDGSVDTWDVLYHVNVRTAFCATQAALPHLLKSGRGRVVNIGAAAAAKASLGMGAYAASKAGVARLTEALSEEFRDRGVTVNAVLPSIIDTPLNRADVPDADFSRWVKPEQIANLIVFLLSDQADAITGALIPVMGRM